MQPNRRKSDEMQRAKTHMGEATELCSLHQSNRCLDSCNITVHIWLLHIPVLDCFNVGKGERTRYTISPWGRVSMYQNCDINLTFTPCAYF